MNIRTVLLVGRPGCGKGTQSALLAEKTGWKVLSSGDRLREIRGQNTPLGEKVKEDYDAGKYLPDWFADYLFEKDIFELSQTQGVVMEGFGRTLDQARHITEICAWLGRPLRVIYIDVPEEEVVKRMVERSKVEHRPDSDTPEKIKVRLQKYDANTKPSLDYFTRENLLKTVDGRGDVMAIHKSILESLEIL